MLSKLSGRPLAKRAIAIAILCLVIYLLMVFAGHPQAVEYYYSDGVYPLICFLLHPVLNLLPFSLGDLIYIGVIIYLLYAVIRFFRLLFKKQFTLAARLGFGVIIGVQTGIILFYILWGLNYFRPSAAERLNLKDSTFAAADLQTVTQILIDSANATRARITPADLRQSNDSIYHSSVIAMKAMAKTSSNFKTYSPDIKPSLLTPVMNYISTSGYYNPFTTEAQINYEMPVFNRPFVACHEMSHQLGYGPEDEANFVGYLAATASGNRLLRYSAYYLAVEEFMHSMRRVDTITYKQLKLKISKEVKEDFRQERFYWLAYQNKINALTGLFYDNFLKVNNQPEGLETYNRMVALVMAMYKKQGSVTLIKKAFRISPRNALQYHLSNDIDQLNLR